MFLFSTALYVRQEKIYFALMVANIATHMNTTYESMLEKKDVRVIDVLLKRRLIYR